jgi:PHP family Zn ribbon phosphoesterase
MDLRLDEYKKEGRTLVDPHCHSHFSDGSVQSELMLAYAKKKGFNLIFMDHNDIRAVQKHHKEMNCAVPGVEITSSTYADFLLYFYNLSELEEYYKKHVEPNKISNNIFNFNRTRLTNEELLLTKENYNCKIVLPHPHGLKPKNSHVFFDNSPGLLKHLDAAESHNSALREDRNLLMKTWVKKNNLTPIVGSDAHVLETLGSALVVVEGFSTNSFLDSLDQEKQLIINHPHNKHMRKSSFHIFKNNLKLRREYGFRFR